MCVIGCVKPGKRAITVAEAIEPVYFNSVQQRQREFRREDHYTIIEIDIKPDTASQLAARFHLGGNILKHEHWDPVVAREAHELCPEVAGNAAVNASQFVRVRSLGRARVAAQR